MIMELYPTPSEAAFSEQNVPTFWERARTIAEEMGLTYQVKQFQDIIDHLAGVSIPSGISHPDETIPVTEGFEIVGHRKLTDEELKGYVIKKSLDYLPLNARILSPDERQAYAVYLKLINDHRAFLKRSSERFK